MRSLQNTLQSSLILPNEIIFCHLQICLPHHPNLLSMISCILKIQGSTWSYHVLWSILEDCLFLKIIFNYCFDKINKQWNRALWLVIHQIPNIFFRCRTVATLQAFTVAAYFNQSLYILLAVKYILSSAPAEFLATYQLAVVNGYLVYQFVLAFLLVLLFILSLCSWPIFTTWNFWFWISECIILSLNGRKAIFKEFF